MFVLFIISIFFAVVSIVLITMLPTIIDLDDLQSISYYAFLLVIGLTLALLYIVKQGGGLI